MGLAVGLMHTVQQEEWKVGVGWEDIVELLWIRRSTVFQLVRMAQKLSHA